MPFFTALEEEIAAAEFEGKQVIIILDAAIVQYSPFSEFFQKNNPTSERTEELPSLSPTIHPLRF